MSGKSALSRPLTRAEDAFRDMKSPPVIRPIFHHKERRTDSHIFLSLLAYHPLTAIEKTFATLGSFSKLPSAVRFRETVTSFFNKDIQGKSLFLCLRDCAPRTPA
jgi:hypothetical protein